MVPLKLLCKSFGKCLCYQWNFATVKWKGSYDESDRKRMRETKAKRGRERRYLFQVNGKTKTETRELRETENRKQRPKCKVKSKRTECVRDVERNRERKRKGKTEPGNRAKVCEWIECEVLGESRLSVQTHLRQINKGTAPSRINGRKDLESLKTANNHNIDGILFVCLIHYVDKQSTKCLFICFVYNNHRCMQFTQISHYCILIKIIKNKHTNIVVGHCCTLAHRTAVFMLCDWWDWPLNSPICIQSIHVAMMIWDCVMIRNNLLLAIDRKR